MPTLFALLAALNAAPDNVPDADAAAYEGTKSGVRYYDFADDDIEGEILSPDGANVYTRGNIRHASMITIRPHFIVELHRLALDT